jgi:hypothetical protein
VGQLTKHSPSGRSFKDYAIFPEICPTCFLPRSRPTRHRPKWAVTPCYIRASGRLSWSHFRRHHVHPSHSDCSEQTPSDIRSFQILSSRRKTLSRIFRIYMKMSFAQDAAPNIQIPPALLRSSCKPLSYYIIEASSSGYSATKGLSFCILIITPHNSTLCSTK